MEELNKTQIVLLAIFITLVTSSATGVIVVTLMDQSPQGINQTINRVVERTVEKVIAPGKVEKTEITQIVREDDNIVASIKKTRQSLVRMIRENNVVAISSGQSIGTQQQTLFSDVLQTVDALEQTAAVSSWNKLDEPMGFIVSSDGLVITSIDIVSEGNVNYLAVLYNDVKVPAIFLKSDKERGIALFKIDSTKLKEKINLVPLTARSYEQISLGQTVIAIGIDVGLNTVSMGYVSGIKALNASSTPLIKTSIKPTENWSGRPIIDTNGLLVGVYGTNNEIVSYQTIKALIDSSAEKASGTTQKII